MVKGDIMDIDRYLTRFNASSCKEVSLQNLENLQNLHLQHIPFENLDVIRKVPIYLNLTTIYNKIVTNNRGGYCYELNGLFHSLLLELGYDAHLVSATVLRSTGEWAKADTHAAILVYLDEPYLVDVGFGAATHRLPVPLNETEKTDVSATYSIKQHDGQLFDLIRKSKSGARTLYRFNAEKKSLIDFHEGCVFNQVAKESSFTHTDVVTRATPTGRITLVDQTLTVYEYGIEEKTELTSEDKTHILQDLFSIDL